jgi:hypothetical protein
VPVEALLKALPLPPAVNVALASVQVVVPA